MEDFSEITPKFRDLVARQLTRTNTEDGVVIYAEEIQVREGEAGGVTVIAPEGKSTLSQIPVDEIAISAFLVQQAAGNDLVFTRMPGPPPPGAQEDLTSFGFRSETIPANELAQSLEDHAHELGAMLSKRRAAVESRQR